MGDRVSISFVNGKEESVAIFNHWGGMGFVKEARTYVRELKKEITEGREKRDRGYEMSGPLGRLEPNTVMVDFIRWHTKDIKKDQRVWSSLYFGTDEDDGDNSDNGHHRIQLDTTELQDTLEEAQEDV